MKQTYKQYAATTKGRLFVAFSGHYEQRDGSCMCGWKPGTEYPEKMHMAHLAEVAANELTVFPPTPKRKRGR